ncbi:MAG: hypothetical protein PHY24_06325 [Candidatus Cloacimonetes bacterium]|nr:hypothetical protein [Candidatus Cloacimonadota bacterium]
MESSGYGPELAYSSGFGIILFFSILHSCDAEEWNPPATDRSLPIAPVLA